MPKPSMNGIIYQPSFTNSASIISFSLKTLFFPIPSLRFDVEAIVLYEEVALFVKLILKALPFAFKVNLESTQTYSIPNHVKEFKRYSKISTLQLS